MAEQRPTLRGENNPAKRQEVRDKIRAKAIGRVMSIEARQKMCLAKKGKPSVRLGAKLSDVTKKKISEFNKGRHNSPETQFKKGSGGEKHWNWQGGITSENFKIRNSVEYADWRTKVFQRDNYICQDCHSKGYKLHADHIKPFAYYPELRLVISNGRTLCVECHKKTPTYGRKTKQCNNVQKSS